MAALKYWIWLSDAAVSARAKAEIMRRYGDAEQAFFAPTGAFAAMESIRREDAETLERRDLDRAERVIEACPASRVLPDSMARLKPAQWASRKRSGMIRSRLCPIASPLV